MATVTGEKVAEKAKELLLMDTIPYVLGGEDLDGMDCQGLVEWVLRELDIDADYAGTNDMWRNMLSDKGTIEEGVDKYNEIPIGACIFIVDDDGEEPEKYQGDGEGNCWHVYIKISDELLIHASASNLCVCTRSFFDEAISGGPSHYGLIDGVEYDGIDIEDSDDDEDENEEETSSTFSTKYSRYKWRKGDKGNGVKAVQTALNLCGYDLDVDGDFGEMTEEAVIDFQEDHDLEDDGIVGKNTWAALIEAANEADD